MPHNSKMTRSEEILQHHLPFVEAVNTATLYIQRLDISKIKDAGKEGDALRVAIYELFLITLAFHDEVEDLYTQTAPSERE